MYSYQEIKKQQISTVEDTVLKDTLSEKEQVKDKKKKYVVNIVFDRKLESDIRNKAEQKGVGVATYIKMLVNEDLNK